MIARISLILVLFIANVATGVGVVYSKHSMRKSFIELQSMQNNFDELQIEWGRFQLEQSAWATHGRVEKIAREKLNMGLVHEERLVFLKTE
ncbi:MAG: cell division protein FtsL [Gammaproteobacteria bacterium]